MSRYTAFHLGFWDVAWLGIVKFSGLVPTTLHLLCANGGHLNMSWLLYSGLVFSFKGRRYRLCAVVLCAG